MRFLDAEFLNGKLRVRFEDPMWQFILHIARWRHVRSQRPYTMLAGAIAQGDIREGQAVVVYAGQNSDLHVRAHEEFHDGRFEREEE